VPILVENQVEAVLNIDRNYINGFSDHDLWTLNSLASQAAASLANARLYRDLAQRRLHRNPCALCDRNRHRGTRDLRAEREIDVEKWAPAQVNEMFRHVLRSMTFRWRQATP
jgi:GAF domain-containing protein